MFSRLDQRNEREKFALIVDGKSLAEVLIYHKQAFIQACLLCHAVLCCRMSPSQKAQVRFFNLNCTKEYEIRFDYENF